MDKIKLVNASGKVIERNKDDYERWACLRPMTPNMLPVVGKVKGLWVNSGAGHLGWTMGMALAERLANDLQKSR